MQIHIASVFYVAESKPAPFGKCVIEKRNTNDIAVTNCFSERRGPRVGVVKMGYNIVARKGVSDQ